MTEDEILKELENLADQPLPDVYDEYTYPFIEFLKHLDRIRDDYDHYKELLSYCDLQREDIVHHLEFNSTDAIERSKLMSRLIEVQRTRRIVKTHLECSQTVMDSWLKTSYLSVHKILTEQITSLKKMSNRRYEYRTRVVQDALDLPETSDEA